MTGYNPDSYTTPATGVVNQKVGVTHGNIHRYADNGANLPSGTTAMWGVGGIYEKKWIMDRNLGALGATFAGHGSVYAVSQVTTNLGTLYYQFGRKDPMPRSLGNPMSTIDGRKNFVYSVQNPMTFVAYAGNWNSETINAAEVSWLWHDKYISIANLGRF